MKTNSRDFHSELVSRVDQISPVTGRVKQPGLLVFHDSSAAAPEHWIGSIAQRVDGSHLFCPSPMVLLSLSDLQTICKRIEQLNAQATEERVQKAQAKNRH